MYLMEENRLIVVGPLKNNNQLITDERQKADALKNHFQSVFSKLSNISETEIKNGNYMIECKTYPIMDDIKITVPGITKLLQKLNLSTACGSDQIKHR